jgi:hypothetical protein
VVQKKSKPGKFDRIFGEDADRIRREAEAMSRGSGKKKSGSTNKAKSGTKRGKR